MADQIILTDGETSDAHARIRLATAGETKSVAQSASQPFDFIRTYVQYADIIEAPPEAHEAVAIQLLATVLNPRVHIQWGGIRIPLDLWILLLSPSGLGRNTLVALTHPILEAARMEDIVRNTSWGSKQAFYQNISEHPAGLFVWPELSVVLKNLADSRFAGVKEWLTDRYDNLTIPEQIRYRETGKKGDTPPIVFSKSPRLNILATSSYDWFTSNLNLEDTTGGFVPRFLLSQARSPGRVVPIPGTPDLSLIRSLDGHLVEASFLDGAANLSEVEGRYREWYVQARQRFYAQPNSALAIPFFNRLRTHVVKLALIYQVSRLLSLRVSPEAMERAIATALSCEKTIFSLLPTGMNREGSAVDMMADRIRQTGASGLAKSELTRAFQSMRANDRESRLKTLRDGEVVVSFLKGTAGRSAEMLVHSDYETEYKNRFPEDKKA